MKIIDTELVETDISSFDDLHFINKHTFHRNSYALRFAKHALF